ncbi:MAG: hypothetical protein D6B25_03525 [Desulfobulbaceae bacterium]|nr:MAG: hypothetical protein D6B25_03525 [Desulfobulbaceae bacterium]
MTKDDLVSSAKSLEFQEKAADDYSEKRGEMVSRVNSKMASRDDIDFLIGEANLEMMKDNHANHGLFIESMLHSYNPEVLVETIHWVFRAYKSRNFHDNYWAAQLNAWCMVIEDTLSEESAKAVLPLYHWMTVNIPQFNALSEQS